MDAQTQRRSIRSLLTRNISIISVGSLIVLTLWFVGLTLFGAHQGGMIWVSGSARALDSSIMLWEQSLNNKAEILANHPQFDDVLAPEEVAFIVSKEGKVSYLRKSDSEGWLKGFDLAEIITLSAGGFYSIRSQIFSISIVDKVAGYSNHRLIFLRKFDSDLLESMSALTNGEIVLYTREGVVNTTIKSRKNGNSVRPSFEEGLHSKLQASAEQSVTDVHTILIPDYQGLTVGGSRSESFSQGEDQFEAYGTFFALSKERGIWVGNIVPRSALLVATKKGLWGSIGLLVLVAIASVKLTSRQAKHLIDPLSEISKKVTDISDQLAKSVGLKRASLGKRSEAAADFNEIAALEASVGAMSKVLGETEQLRRQLESERAKSFASTKLAALGEMAGGVAHEINSPLTVISTRSSQLLELLQSGEAEPVITEQFVSEIEATAQRIAKIVNGLRSFSRDGSQDPFTMVCVENIVEDTIAFCQERLQHRGIRLEVGEISKGLALECRATQISEVLLNLIHNSMDAIDKLPDRWVRLDILDRGEFLDFSVTDSGCGMSQEVAEKIFNPFYTTKPVGKGTGLGLGISQKIAEAHRGTVQVDQCSPNTKFVLSIPKHQTLIERAAV